MRTIEKKMLAAFMAGKNWKSGNTKVVCNDQRRTIYLHGNAIALAISKQGSATPWRLFITAAGWMTVTTKSRLNALPGISIYQDNWKWYLNGSQWDGDVIKITENYLPLK